MGYTSSADCPDKYEGWKFTTKLEIKFFYLFSGGSWLSGGQLYHFEPVYRVFPISDEYDHQKTDRVMQIELIIAELSEHEVANKVHSADPNN